LKGKERKGVKMKQLKERKTVQGGKTRERNRKEGYGGWSY
jgi:hypothetical protein